MFLQILYFLRLIGWSGFVVFNFFRRFVRMETGNDSIFLHNFADSHLKALRKDRVKKPNQGYILV